jgi:murein DD-endopeptidase MepM/ murein hydrolase activator NlpD
MTGRRRSRAALATLITGLGLLGLWAIPAASASTTGTVPADTVVAQQCVTAEFPNGIAMPFEIPASDPVPTDGASLALDDPTPALPNPSDVLQVIAGCSSSVPTTGTTSSSSTTTTSPATSSSTSTTTSGSTATTTTTTTTTAPTSTSPPTTGTTRTSPTHTGTTPTTTTTTGPGAPHKQPTSSTPAPGAKHSSNSKSKHHQSSNTHTKSKHKRHKTTSAKKKKTTKKRSTGGKGSPATTPATSLTLPPAPPVGVPNLFLDSFQIPPFLLPIYQAAGIQYQVPWQVLAAINEIETDYGRNLSVSSAGAVGWMQFMPATWKEWGIDANGDGVADPFNPVDAIFSAARYLQAAGAATNLSKAVFAYNHADWYVNQVLLRAKLIGAMPQSVIGALTGLVEGHFPVAAAAHYSDGSIVALTKHRVTSSNAAVTVDSDPASTGTSIFAKRGSPVVAVNDGKVVKLGGSATLGRYVQLQDATGNVYTYAELGTVSSTYPVPKPVVIDSSNAASELGTGSADTPTTAASVGTQPTVFTDSVKGTQARLALAAQSRSALAADAGDAASETSAVPKSAASAGGQSGAAGGSQTSSETATQASTVSAPLAKERLFAHPARPASYAAGGIQQLHNVSNAISSFKNYFADTLHLAKNQYTLQPLRVGSIVIAGTVLGRVAAPSQSTGSHLYFQIQPAGHDAPRIDPKPILDGWKLLQATDVYGAKGVNPFYGGLGGSKSKDPTVGQVLLMSKQQLERRVLTDPHVQLYACGQRDIEAGKIDRRVLAAIEYLSTSGLHPDVTGLACDASVNGTTGVDEAGSTGQSVDISAINGVPIAGHTGVGSVTDQTIRRLLALQGSMAPTQIIGPISYRDQSTTLALPSHDNRIQILFGTSYGSNGAASKQVESILKRGQWTTLINRLSEIPEPVVPVSPSRYAIRQPAH